MKVNIGGLYRCCVQYAEIQPFLPDDTVIQCPYCKAKLVARGGELVWEGPKD